MADSIQKRENRLGKHVLCWVMTLTFLTLTNASQHCGFTFPSLTPDLKLTKADNSEVVLPFKLDMSQCQRDVSQEVNIVIYKPQKDQPREQGVCFIILEKEECVSTTNKTCHCKDNDIFVFSWKMTTADSGVWHWRVAETDVSAEVRFSIQAQSAGKSQTTSPSSTTLKFKEKSPTEMRTPNVNDRKGVTAKHDVTKTNAVQKEIQDSGSKTNDGVVDKDDGGEAQSDSNMGPVFVGVNVGAFILVAIIVFVVLRRRQKNKRNQQATHPPKAPCDREDDVMFVGRRPEPLVGDVRNSYELPGIPTPRHYDRLSSARRETMNSDYIEVRESGYGYELVV